MSMSKTSAVLALALTLSLIVPLVGGCGPAPGPALAKEQIVRLPTSEPPTLDPGLAVDLTSLDIIVQIFEGLLEFDNEGKPVPLIAEKWDVSPDGLTWTFHLRKGPKWSDGNPVTAKDFEYAWKRNWKRNADPKTASDYAPSLYPIKGAQDFNKGKTTDPSTVMVKAKDDSTLEVILAEPAAYFLTLASTWTLFPLPHKAIEKYGAKWTEAANIVSNGPFKMEKWDHDREIVLVKNKDYWGKKPTLDKAMYRLFPEGSDAQVLAAYENKELDANVGIPPADVDRVTKDPVLGKEVKIFDLSGTTFVAINTTRKPFDDPKVRLALYHAVDRQKLLDVGKIIGTPAYTVTPPGIAGRNPEAFPKPDVATAKKLLADAGYPDGKGFPEVNYAYNTAARNKMVAEFLQAQWKENLGINIKLTDMEWKVFLKFRTTEPNRELWRGNWISDYEDPNNWYNMLWDSNSNYFGLNWKNDAYDQLVRAARGQTDLAKRKKTYEDAEAIIAKDMPMIPLWHAATRVLVRPYVEGFTPSRILGFSPLKGVRVLAH